MAVRSVVRIRLNDMREKVMQGGSWGVGSGQQSPERLLVPARLIGAANQGQESSIWPAGGGGNNPPSPVVTGQIMSGMWLARAFP